MTLVPVRSFASGDPRQRCLRPRPPSGSLPAVPTGARRWTGRQAEYRQGSRVAGGAAQPETRYARLGGDRIAYQVLGQGPPDLVFTMGSFSHVDVAWEDPQIALFLRRLASFSRLLRFDRRGTGASDPLPADPLPPWEAYAEELVAVLDAAGVERAALLTAGPEAGPMALFFAGTRPDRTSALIIADATARYLAADDYPIGVPPDIAETVVARAEELWGTETNLRTSAPARARDERFLRCSARLQRAIASPGVVRAYLQAMLEVDVRSILPLIQAPTLVLHHTGFQQLPIAHGRYLAEHIPGARLLQVPDDLAGRLVDRWGGRLVKTTGDGILATFDGPGRAVGCAAALREELRGIGTEIRAGLHSGEVELRDGDVGGIAVHIAARVLAAASPGEVLVSRTVRDLVTGSETVLEDRGAHHLKGVQGTWQLFAVGG